MKNTTILFLTVLIIISILQLGCGTSKDSDSSSIEKGEALIRNLKFDEADEVFKNFIEKDSLNYQGLYGSALVDEHRFKFIDALVKYMTVVESAENIPGAYLGLYRMYKFFDMPTKAFATGYKYIELSGKSLESSRIQAEILLASNKSKRLRKEISAQSLFADHEGEENFYIAQTFQLENSFDSAQFYFEAGLNNSDKSPAYYLAASGFLARAGLIDSAITFSAKAIELSNYDYLITVDHYFMLLKNNYFDQANHVIQKLKSLGLDHKTVQLLHFYNYFYQQRFNMSRYALNEFMRNGSTGFSRDFYDFLIGCKRDEGKSPSDLMKMILSNMYRTGYSNEILNDVNYILLRDFSITKNPVSTLKEIDKLPGTFFSKQVIRLMKIEQLYLSGQEREAENEISALSKSNASNLSWLTKLGDIYKNIQLRKYDKAERNYRDALGINKWYRPAFENYVQMFRQSENYKKGLQVFKDYPHFEKKYPDLKILKAVCLVESGDLDQGLKLLEQSIGNKKEDLTIFKDLFYAAHLQKNNLGVEKILSLLESYNGNNSEALTLASDKYLQLNNYEKSKSLSLKAIELNSENNDAKVINAFANYKLGGVQSAEQILNNIIVEDKYNSKANMYLAQLLATEGKDFDQASNLARKAVSFSQYGYDEWMTLCYAYYQMGRYDLCRGEAIKSSRKYDKLPVPYYWLGLCQFEEEKEGAKENLTKALKFGLSGEMLKIANDVLKQL